MEALLFFVFVVDSYMCVALNIEGEGDEDIADDGCYDAN